MPRAAAAVGAALRAQVADIARLARGILDDPDADAEPWEWVDEVRPQAADRRPE